MNILIIEDDESISSMLKQGLIAISHTVEIQDNGIDGLESAKKNNYDFIILDILMPGMNGIEVCQSLRKNNMSVPILMLTAKNTMYDKLTGLNTGADDYMTKPFSFETLLIHMNDILRRKKEVAPESRLKNEFTIIPEKLSVNCSGTVVQLTQREFLLLSILAGKKDQIVSVEEIESTFLRHGIEIDTNSVRVHINHLKKKLEVEGVNSPLQSVYKKGYIFKPSVDIVKEK